MLVFLAKMLYNKSMKKIITLSIFISLLFPTLTFAQSAQVDNQAILRASLEQVIALLTQQLAVLEAKLAAQIQAESKQLSEIQNTQAAQQTQIAQIITQVQATPTPTPVQIQQQVATAPQPMQQNISVILNPSLTSVQTSQGLSHVKIGSFILTAQQAVTLTAVNFSVANPSTKYNNISLYENGSPYGNSVSLAGAKESGLTGFSFYNFVAPKVNILQGDTVLDLYADITTWTDSDPLPTFTLTQVNNESVGTIQSQTVTIN
jgi:Tfp pilus assembly protein PilE